jgi:hypothetical protein
MDATILKQVRLSLRRISDYVFLTQILTQKLTLCGGLVVGFTHTFEFRTFLKTWLELDF